MSWQVIWRGERPSCLDENGKRIGPDVIGDAWWSQSQKDWDEYYNEAKKSWIYSKQFVAKYEAGDKRRPIMIQFPPYSFCIDAPWYNSDLPNGGNPEHDGWTVLITGPMIVGQPLNVTLAPSVGLGKGMKDYHGFLTNGIISDDLSGKKYN